MFRGLACALAILFAGCLGQAPLTLKLVSQDHVDQIPVENNGYRSCGQEGDRKILELTIRVENRDEAQRSLSKAHWRVVWTDHEGTPLEVWGPSVSSPGSNVDVRVFTCQPDEGSLKKVVLFKDTAHHYVAAELPL